MTLLYNLFLVVYSFGIRVVSIWNNKAKLWVKGRENFFENLKNTSTVGTKKKVWMHCSSLGEFEQGRPVLKKLMENDPGISVVITFFSPSGYEIAKNDKDFSQVYYMPMDSPANAKKLLDILKPELVLWVKYEYWHYYLQEIKRRNIPLLLISGVYQPNQVFFKWYGSFYRKMLECFTHFFVQNASSKDQLQKLIAEEKITVSGDTRCDRVINIAENFTEVDGIASFCGNKKVIVAGSTWEDDEAEWTHFVKTHVEIKFIIAPHEIDDENLADIKKEFPGSIFYSEWMTKPVLTDDTSNCMIIDNIGMLSRLYKYATITYVGGGFGYNGLHNILEAAVYGKPVIFGPEYEKNFEAEELIDCSGAISIENALELEKVVNSLLNNEEEITSRGNAAKNYVYGNAGASQKIVEFIQRNRLLIN
ncbi:MAG TPA: glycosyltransferase N-terminal domain-containing protein [Ginsengibacter sp.]|nr:glycosyltransferase N-terminal domain-containing protein [Ginsengibacter sp.]